MIMILICCQIVISVLQIIFNPAVTAIYINFFIIIIFIIIYLAPQLKLELGWQAYCHRVGLAV